MYRHLIQNQLQRLTQEIRELSGVEPETATEVLDEYQRLSLAQEYLAQGWRAVRPHAAGEGLRRGWREGVCWSRSAAPRC